MLPLFSKENTKTGLELKGFFAGQEERTHPSRASLRRCRSWLFSGFRTERCSVAPEKHFLWNSSYGQKCLASWNRLPHLTWESDEVMEIGLLFMEVWNSWLSSCQKRLVQRRPLDTTTFAKNWNWNWKVFSQDRKNASISSIPKEMPVLAVQWFSNWKKYISKEVTSISKNSCKNAFSDILLRFVVPEKHFLWDSSYGQKCLTSWNRLPHLTWESDDVPEIGRLLMKVRNPWLSSCPKRLVQRSAMTQQHSQRRVPSLSLHSLAGLLSFHSILPASRRMHIQRAWKIFCDTEGTTNKGAPASRFHRFYRFQA